MLIVPICSSGMILATPSLHLKRIGRFWSVRAGLRHRALAIEATKDTLPGSGLVTHTEYDQLLQRA